MNLGDSLKLETRVLDGKPKLILATCDSQPKEAKKQVTSKTKSTKHPLRVEQMVRDAGSVCKNHTKQEKSVTKTTCINGTVPGVSLLAKKIPRENAASLQKTNGVAKNITKEHMQTPSRGSAVNQNTKMLKSTDKKASSLKQGPQKKQKISAEDVRETLVCLTQEQFQKILSSITQTSKSSSANQGTEKKEELVHETTEEQSKVTVETREESIASLLGKDEVVSSNYVNSNSGQNEKHEAVENKRATPELTSADQNKDPPDFFKTLGERENDKVHLDARKAQWRKELDEQVTAKKKERALQQTQKEVYLWGKSMGDTSLSCSFKNGLAECLTKATLVTESDNAVKEERMVKTASAAENTEKSFPHNTSSGKPASFSSPDLPAAIRCAFVLGEAAPLEHPFSAVKREQQKKWLEELDKQREETKARKIQDKMKRMEAEEHEKWAVHFDSFQKKPSSVPQHQSSTHGQNPKNLSISLEAQASDAATIFPSVPSHVASSENNNVIRNSVDAASGDNQKHSFLRSMTALLDPAQIEERERKHQKQLEYNKAIAEQVKERQMLKMLEEAKRRQEEQAEERRLALEREKMQKQFEEDMLKQKKKEKLHMRKINEPYQSVQQTQEQAVKLKQEQLIKEHLQKGHNISNLQRHLGEEQSPVNHTAVAVLTSVASSTDVNKSELTENEAVVSPRKDTAVQTDNYEVADKMVSSGMYSGLVIERRVMPVSPDIPVEYRASSNFRKLKSESKFVERNATGEEISKYSNLSDKVIRTQKHHPTNVERLGKKPEWNTSKPVKKYITASERYPTEMQKEREENKKRRQMEILDLVERNAFENLGQKKRSSPRNVLPDIFSASPDHITDRGGRAPHKKEENMQKENLDNRTHGSLENRPNSPPVPAVKNRLHQLQQRQMNASKYSVYNDTTDKNRTISKDNPMRNIPEISDLETERPPSAHFVPYLRTNEVYHLDPDAPLSRPSTQDTYQKLYKDSSQGGQMYNSSQVRDLLLNPDLLKNRDRQQAILRGLAELRQTLLQKDKELESGLSPGILH